MIDKTKAIDLLLAYNEAVFCTQSFTTIDGWINDGCDLEQDVLPWMREATTKFKDITSVSWFQKGVYRRKKEREERELVASRVAVKNAPPDAETEARKAKMLAKTIRVFNVRRPDQIQWLAEYEAKHGRVEC